MEQPIEMDFDLTKDVPLPCECPECGVCPTTTTTLYPVCPTTTTCPSCEECKECPVCEYDPIMAFLGFIFGGFAVYIVGGKIKLDRKSVDKLIEAMPKGCGLRLFKAYTGKSDLRHYHRSPKKYHDLSDRHHGIYDHGGETNLFPNFGD